MATLNITVDATRAILKIQRFRAGIDANVWLSQIGQRLLEWTEENFDKEGAEKPWEKLSPKTVLKKGNARILQESGDLKGSFIMNKIGPAKISVFPTDPKAPWHHFGTGPRTITSRNLMVFINEKGEEIHTRKIEKHKIPARPLLPSVQLAQRMGIEVSKNVISKAAASVRTS